jgi:molecular chaperone DnaK
MMAKDPGQRQRTALEVARQLNAWLARENTDGAPTAVAGRSASAGRPSSPGASAQPAVGIDLGTTYSAVAYLDGEQTPVTILNAEGDPTTPSVVFFDRAGPVVGKEALKAAEFEPERVAEFAKRDMGDAHFHKPLGGRRFPPEVIQALVLQKLKQDAQVQVGELCHAVITVPAYFNEPRRKATQDAGQLAGLEVLDIINEPTAAALAYGVKQGFLNAEGQSRRRETILVYDLGGGTFDVTLMDIAGGHYRALATAGDVYLGGIDWDERIAGYAADRFLQEHQIDLRQEPGAWERLLHEAADAKRGLTAREEVTIRVANDSQRLRLRISRGELESLTADLLERTRATIKRLLQETRLDWGRVTRVILVGGATRMPMVRRMLEAESGRPVDRSLSPDEAVAQGAAIYAGVLLKQAGGRLRGISVRNVNSHDLGVLAVERATGRRRRRLMIGRNTELPASAEAQFRTARAGQPNVLVPVVEGGTDSGAHATHIGQCVVKGLPADLPAQSPVKVSFHYQQNGRLAIRASLPSIKRGSRLVIERAKGLSESQLEQWQAAIDAGVRIDADPLAPGDGRDEVERVGAGEDAKGAGVAHGTDRAGAEADAFPVLGSDPVGADDSICAEDIDVGETRPEAASTEETSLRQFLEGLP